jgi:uncharacterized protein (TIGR03437 family)
MYKVSGIPATSAGLEPWDVAVDPSGNIYIADSYLPGVLVVTPPGAAPPSITSRGVFTAAGYIQEVIANSWLSVQGANLAPITDDWSNSIVNGNLPTLLDGVSVTIGGKPAYIDYISPTQLNVLAPDLPTGPSTIVVTTSFGASASYSTTVSQTDPAFFPWPGNQPVATHQDYSFAVKPGTFPTVTTTAAKPGEIITLWGAGFGPTTPPIPVGVTVPATTSYAVVTVPQVTINGLQATVYSAVLSPGAAGLYQIAIQVPGTLADGDWPLLAVVGGHFTPTNLILSVHH